jgi:hypothetical protein
MALRPGGVVGGSGIFDRRTKTIAFAYPATAPSMLTHRLAIEADLLRSRRFATRLSPQH